MRALLLVLIGCGRLGFHAIGGADDDGGVLPPDVGLNPTQEVYIKATNTNAHDAFGTVVCLSGDGATLAVATPNEQSAATGIDGNQADNTAAQAGAVYIYVRTGESWAFQAYVKASNTNTSDSFGSSCAISADGNTLAVGAPFEQSNATGINGNQANNSLFGAGAVYIFTRSNTAWTQQAYVKASDTKLADMFGASVAMSATGDLLVVGAPVSTDTASGPGNAYVFTRGSTTWTQQKILGASNADGTDRFGLPLAVSADGSTVAVAAQQEASNATGINGDQNDNSLTFAGAVYVFANNNNTWVPQAYIKASNTLPYWFFGSGLALSGDGNTLVAGAYGESSNATGVGGDQLDRSIPNAGAAWVYSRSGTAWTQQAYLKASRSTPPHLFGAAVAISNDGNTVLVGGTGDASATTVIDGDDADTSATNSGAVYAFARSGTTWGQTAYIKASNANMNDGFGEAVALSADGKIAIASAPNESSNTTGVGGNQADNSLVAAGAVYAIH